MRIAVLASGGLDSAVLVGHLARRAEGVQPIYVRFGLRWEAVEEEHLRRFLATLPSVRPLVTFDLPIADVYGAHWSTGGDVPGAESPDEAVYLPGRNLLLLSKAAVWCALNEIEAIALGVLRGNPFSDASPEFFAALAPVLARALGAPIELLTPFAELTKRQVIELGRGLELGLTFSCIAPREGRHCGRCNKCAERRRAFEALRAPDPTSYAE